MKDNKDCINCINCSRESLTSDDCICHITMDIITQWNFDGLCPHYKERKQGEKML